MTYDKKYKTDTYYWGKEPSASAMKLLEHVKSDSNNKLTLLDLGCGEGRNAICFAKNNFIVTAVDISQTGLDKTKKLADENNLSVLTKHGDVRTISLLEKFNVIFSSGTIHYLSPEIREKQISHIQNHTIKNGINALNVFVSKPFVEKAPDAEDTAYLYKSGELLGFYADWEILYLSETIFDCNSGGVAHQHTMNTVIAKKVI